MKTILSICLLTCGLGAASFAAEATGVVPEEAEPPSSARAVGPSDAAEVSAASPRAILGDMLSRMPREPIVIRGRLIMRKQGGLVVKEAPFSMEMDWGAEPATATYTLFDHFDRPTMVAGLTRSPDGTSAMSLHDGTGKPLPVPSLTDPVAGTDLTWLDISLSYLWWPEARLDGEEEFRGALCDRVIVVPPRPLPGCASVRLWIDRKRGVLRQAEQLDAEGNRRRWMWVASVGKINDRWMIRNLEVKRPNTGLQTKLHVDDLETP